MGPRKRRFLCQSAHLRVSYSTSRIDFHGPIWLLTSVEQTNDALCEALSEASPTVPTARSIWASAKRSVYLMDRYWAVSTGRRNTFDHIRFDQVVECFCWCLPAECLAWAGVQRVEHELGLRRCRGTPTHDPPREGVDLEAQGGIRLCAGRGPVRIARNGTSVVVAGRGELQYTADRLCPERPSAFLNEIHHLRNGRSSSAIAKYADAFFRISFTCRSSRTSRSNALIRAFSAVV
jgi:hypothetical protein